MLNAEVLELFKTLLGIGRGELQRFGQPLADDLASICERHAFGQDIRRSRGLGGLFSLGLISGVLCRFHGRFSGFIGGLFGLFSQGLGNRFFARRLSRRLGLCNRLFNLGFTLGCGGRLLRLRLAFRRRAAKNCECFGRVLRLLCNRGCELFKRRGMGLDCGGVHFYSFLKHLFHLKKK